LSALKVAFEIDNVRTAQLGVFHGWRKPLIVNFQPEKFRRGAERRLQRRGRVVRIFAAHRSDLGVDALQPSKERGSRPLILMRCAAPTMPKVGRTVAKVSGATIFDPRGFFQPS
jgi:hypothetical protein